MLLRIRPSPAKSIKPLLEARIQRGDRMTYLTSLLAVGFSDREVHHTFRMTGFTIIEGLHTIMSAIEDLVYHNNVSRVGVMLKAAAGVGGEHVGATGFLQCPDISTKIDFSGHDVVLPAMAIKIYQ